MVQLADLFSVPEMSLLCNVAEYFERSHIDYHPEILFRDVKVRFASNSQTMKIRLCITLAMIRECIARMHQHQ
jgi:competence transcription factor ComK